jgi:hypothetical protein
MVAAVPEGYERDDVTVESYRTGIHNLLEPKWCIDVSELVTAMGALARQGLQGN